MADAALAGTNMYAVADRRFRAKRLLSFGIPGLVLLYFTYIFFAFDVPGLFERARWENAQTLVSDMVSHKTHVTRDNRNGSIEYAVEGETKGAFEDGERPDWVSGDEAGTLVIDLEDGHVVTFGPDNFVSYEIPGYGTVTAQPSRATGMNAVFPEGTLEEIEAMISERAVEMQIGDRMVTRTVQEGSPLPEWINASDTRVTITTDAGRLTITRNRTEVFRYFWGWELFWFSFDSPYHGHGFFEILFGERIDPERANIPGAWHDFLNNRMWQHGMVFWAIGETVLMAFLGTMGAALIALPLAFLAARNFTPYWLIRGTIRRIFDFVRGVDALIWTIILSRAFGLGPLTGTLAILITDGGTFGKIFSEALENVDKKEIEGVASTGARPLQKYRFGVIPQIFPILLAQVLYFLESNTRSATIIGAITGGGIGLLLTQAIITQKDWEEVTYYITLVVIMVMAMDAISGWLRKKLIKGETAT